MNDVSVTNPTYCLTSLNKPDKSCVGEAANSRPVIPRGAARSALAVHA